MKKNASGGGITKMGHDIPGIFGCAASQDRGW